VRTWHGRLAASGLHHNTVAKIYRLFRSIMTTAVDDGLIARNPVRIKCSRRSMFGNRDGDQRDARRAWSAIGRARQVTAASRTARAGRRN
jgi:hypothetical protein